MKTYFTFALTAFAITLLSFISINNGTLYKADVTKSTLVWTGKKVTGEHTGNIKLSNGSLTVDGKTLKSGSFEIDMTTITCTDLTDKTYNEKLIGHLKSDDFFSVEKFPKAKFATTEIKNVSGNNYSVTGDLTIKGITNKITFPATITTAGNTLTADAVITVDRAKYDVRYGSGSFFDNLGDKTIDDNFIINLKLVANK